MENYKLPYVSKKGTLEHEYQEVLAGAFDRMEPGGPRLMWPRPRIRGRAWKHYKEQR